jgi:hypothetical protein
MYFPSATMRSRRFPAEDLMQLHLGPPPNSPDFAPEQDGWTALREPSPTMLNFIAGPVGIAAAALVALGWSQTPTAVQFHVSGNSLTSIPVISASVLLGFIALVAVHEMVHALGYPRCGWTPATIIGLWPTHMLFYAAYLDHLGRNRLLLVYVLPFLVISLLPLIVCASLKINSPPLMAISVINALFCGGDFTCFALILWQVPSNAQVRNQGWATWWKVTS